MGGRQSVIGKIRICPTRCLLTTLLLMAAAKTIRSQGGLPSGGSAFDRSDLFC
jgi:hypothetical protein